MTSKGLQQDQAIPQQDVKNVYYCHISMRLCQPLRMLPLFRQDAASGGGVTWPHPSRQFRDLNRLISLVTSIIVRERQNLPRLILPSPFFLALLSPFFRIATLLLGGESQSLGILLLFLPLFLISSAPSPSSSESDYKQTGFRHPSHSVFCQ